MMRVNYQQAHACMALNFMQRLGGLRAAWIAALSLLAPVLVCGSVAAGPDPYDMDALLNEAQPYAADVQVGRHQVPPTVNYISAPAIASSAAGAPLFVPVPSAAPASGAVAAATPVPGNHSDVKFKLTDLSNKGTRYPIDVYDPLEGFNRGVYWFNAKFDDYIYLPIVDAYEFVTPEAAQDMITGFFDNIGEITTFANQVAQGRPLEAGTTIARFVINSTLGIAGFFNPAEEVGLPRVEEDFGQTMGRWGVGEGPYLVLPLLGPSNLRDGVGTLADFAALAILDPYSISSFQLDYPYVTAVKLIDARHKVGFRYYETGSPFEYDLIRFLYTSKRRLDIRK